jgi:hypothetical protein
MPSESPAAILYDEDGNPVLVSTDGVRALSMRDEETLGLLKQILDQLETLNKIMAYAVDLDTDTFDLE